MATTIQNPDGLNVQSSLWGRERDHVQHAKVVGQRDFQFSFNLSGIALKIKYVYFCIAATAAKTTLLVSYTPVILPYVLFT